MDSGEVEMFHGWDPTQHRAGSGQGRHPFSPSVNVDEIAALSADMSIKCAVVNIPTAARRVASVSIPRRSAVANSSD